MRLLLAIAFCASWTEHVKSTETLHNRPPRPSTSAVRSVLTKGVEALAAAWPQVLSSLLGATLKGLRQQNGCAKAVKLLKSKLTKAKAKAKAKARY